MRLRTARVMTTLMRNGRDRRSETRENLRAERARESDWERSADHIRASGQAAAFKGRIHDRTRTRPYMSFLVQPGVIDPVRAKDAPARSCTCASAHRQIGDGV